jgi:hypothetical protein
LAKVYCPSDRRSIVSISLYAPAFAILAVTPDPLLMSSHTDASFDMKTRRRGWEGVAASLDDECTPSVNN